MLAWVWNRPAAAFQLDFLFLVEEPYDLVAYEARAQAQPLSDLFSWLASARGREAVGALPGYDSTHTGEVLTLG